MKLSTLASLVLALTSAHAHAQAQTVNPAWGVGAFGGVVGVMKRPTTTASSSLSPTIKPSSTTTESTSNSSTSTNTTIEPTTTTTIMSTVTSTLLVTRTRSDSPPVTATPAVKVKREMMHLKPDPEDAAKPYHTGHGIHHQHHHHTEVPQSQTVIADVETKTSSSSGIFNLLISHLMDFRLHQTEGSSRASPITIVKGNQDCGNYLIGTSQPLNSKICLDDRVVTCELNTGDWKVVADCMEVGQMCEAPQLQGRGGMEAVCVDLMDI